jgi:hypothetical protein
MKTKLTLTSPLFLKNGNRADAIAAAIRRSTAELEGDIKLNIRDSVPAGRVYRRTPIVRKANRKNTTLNLRKTAKGDVIVGYNFHRASKAGQPPAIDTGRLINSIRGLPVSDLVGRVSVSVSYGIVLDDPEGLNRPFFTGRVELYRPQFFENIRKAFLGE